ncbi:DUF2937 family protein [Amphiplicatus metriothermophilus]|uniref:DUF2937 family protein n=1 Tax=Amphiplicatus metriothermophilus TaxID=1519374 RepID=A0A239PM18_9PROT|nr:DUF2937 family protein [Amphiplicatus metriothermophilus]MBB5517521.1 hypothetical protein [Amphiplicatus metriothermophilus]SNT68144.1 Protein of unknown function [Amphiplicatus metriothermophilus]
MFARLIAILFGLAAGAAGSQAPGFTLQYMQNLTGRVEELRAVVARYDAVAAEAGLSREGYVADLRATGRTSADKTADAVEETYARHEKLAAHLAALKAAGDYARPLVLARRFEPDIARSAYAEYRPAIPATLDGAAYAGGAFAVVWGGLSFLFGLFGTAGGRRYA